MLGNLDLFQDKDTDISNDKDTYNQHSINKMIFIDINDILYLFTTQR